MKVIYTILFLTTIIFSTISIGQTTNFTLIDINTAGSNSSSPQNLTKVGTTLFFSANDGISGRELWKSDGTLVGTVLVKDIFPGDHSEPNFLTDVNGTLYFGAKLSNPNFKLFKSDGTSGGTLEVERSGGGSLFEVSDLKAFNGTLYFAANGLDGAAVELWRLNGGVPERVANINPGTNSNPTQLTEVGGKLYLNADGPNGVELWVHDPSGGGLGTTTEVADINTSGNSNPSNLTNVNGVLYFTATDDGTDIELWKYDPGAGPPTEIEINTAGSSNPSELINIGGVLYFAADDNDAGGFNDLWKIVSNGSTPAKDASGLISPSRLTIVNGTLYFYGFDFAGGAGGELFKVTPPAIAVRVENTNPDLGTSSKDPGTPGSIRSLGVAGNKLLFSAFREDGTTGLELWQTDGTEANTDLGQDIESGTGDSNPQNITVVGVRIFLTATTAANGTELYVDNSFIVLPLSIFEFKGQLVQNNGLLQWKTTNETNTSSFIIERSMDGRMYTSVGTVAASGNISGVRNYQFTDPNITSLSASIIYYRIQQRDKDGHLTYSRIIALPISSNNALVNLYPNPVKDEANLMFSVSQNENLHWQIIDNAGRVLKQNNQQLPAGSSSFGIDVKGLIKGVYYLRIRSHSIQKQISFVKE